jgi:hypothetical protein
MNTDKLLKLAIIAGLAYGGYYLWKQSQTKTAAAAAGKGAKPTSGNDIYGEIGSTAKGVGSLVGSLAGLFGGGTGASRGGSGAAKPATITTGEGNHPAGVSGGTADDTLDPNEVSGDDLNGDYYDAL